MPVLDQLNDVRKQLGGVADQFDLDKRLGAATDKLGLAERKKVLGVPVGSKRTDWDKVGGIAKVGAAAVAAVVGTKLLSRGKDAAVQKGEQVKEKGRQAKQKGEEAAGKVRDITDKVADVQDAADEASTPVGKAMKVAQALSSNGDGTTTKQRLIIQDQIDIAVPRRVVYDQWTQFEDLPERSHAIQDVTQEDDETTKWQGKILFSTRNWEAEIVQQVPDRRIVWESSGDVDHRGVVTFHALADELTRVQVEMEYHPQGVVEKIGNLFLTVRHRVRKDLRLFKHRLEFEAEATGAWRGEIGDQPEGHDRGEDATESTGAEDTPEEAGTDGTAEAESRADDGEQAEEPAPDAESRADDGEQAEEPAPDADADQRED
jgi:uncharacterized membrane protein